MPETCGQPLIVARAKGKMAEFGAQFSDMFVERPMTPAQKSARAYFLGLGEAERGVLSTATASTSRGPGW